MFCYLVCAHMWINLWVCVHSCSLLIGPSSLSVSVSFTSLVLWTSHTSEVTSEHASPQPGVIKSSRQWKTGEKWLNGSLYSYWCLTHLWYHLSPEGVYEEILMYFIHYIWKCRLLISCEHFYMNNQYMDSFIYMWSFIVFILMGVI